MPSWTSEDDLKGAFHFLHHQGRVYRTNSIIISVVDPEEACALPHYPLHTHAHTHTTRTHTRTHTHTHTVDPLLFSVHGVKP